MCHRFFAIKKEQLGGAGKLVGLPSAAWEVALAAATGNRAGNNEALRLCRETRIRTRVTSQVKSD